MMSEAAYAALVSLRDSAELVRASGLGTQRSAGSIKESLPSQLPAQILELENAASELEQELTRRVQYIHGLRNYARDTVGLGDFALPPYCERTVYSVCLMPNECAEPSIEVVLRLRSQSYYIPVKLLDATTDAEVIAYFHKIFREAK